MRIAYLINQYPKVSHSFIRREIEALERGGVQVMRHALRGWDAELLDNGDLAEQGRTHYLLKDGVVGLLTAMARMLLRQPLPFWRTLALALKLSRRSDRPVPLWLAYFAEACKLARSLHKAGIEHVHAHFGTNSAAVAMLASSLGACSYSFTVHGPEEFDKPEFIHLGEKIRRARFVVAISSYGRSQLYRWVPQTQWPKVQVVRCGLEKAFYDVPDTPVLDVPQFLCVGRLCEQKGQLLLVEAAAMLRAKGREFRLILAGDGEMRGALEALIHQRDLHREVQITGWVSSGKVRELMLASRAIVLPSFAEGLPVVLMEALALRRPVITTSIAGIPELVQDTVNGWLVVPGSVHALVKAMEAALDTLPERLRAMGLQGRQAALKAHDVDTEAGTLAGLFRRLTAVTSP
jgi:glycosyltransferase involved in cell wall biosynthesis